MFAKCAAFICIYIATNSVFSLIVQVSFMHGAWALQVSWAQVKKRMFTHLNLSRASSWSHTLCCVFLVGGNTLCCSPSQLTSRISEKNVVLELVSFEIYGFVSHWQCFALNIAECKEWHDTVFPLFINFSLLKSSSSTCNCNSWCSITVNR